NSSDDEDVGGHEESNKSDESDDDSNETVKAGAESEEESNDEENQDLRLSEEARIQEKEDADELYRDVNINQRRGLQVTQNVKDTRVTLTPVNPDGPQESSSMSSFVSSMLNPISDVGVESIFTTTSSPIVSLQTPTPIMTPSTIATITTSSHWRHPSSSIDKLIRLQDLLQRENDEFLCNIDENMKKIIKGQVKNQVKEQVSHILPRIEESVNATLEAEALTRSSYSSRTSYAIALVEAYEADKAILDTYGDSTILKRRREDDDQEGPSAGSNQGSKQKKKETTCQIEEPPHPVFETGADDQPIVQTSQHPECDLAKQTDARSSFNELLDTPINFSNFIMHRLNVDTLTHDLLAGPTYELMRGSCTSLTELEYHLEEVYKATTDQLDWVNPEGQQYPHNLLQPLPLIPDNRGRRVIPFEHFINNDPEYLRGGASSRKYTTFVTKTKAANYGYIKWIDDLVPREMW
nr:hypothetical protein [Tanacetum cinerariifolium]